MKTNSSVEQQNNKYPKRYEYFSQPTPPMQQTKTNKQQRRTSKTKCPSPTLYNVEVEDAAVKAALEFAKSDDQQPSKIMVDAVNRYLAPTKKTIRNIPIQTLISHRVMLARKLSIKLISKLDYQELEKADKALSDIATTFVRLTKHGSDYIADIAKNNNMASVVINRQTATAFRKGLLSIDDLLNMSDI